MASQATEECSRVAEDGIAEEDDYDSEEHEETEKQKAKQALTGRGVTLANLMEDGLIQPGENVLAIDYRGQRFEADLLPSGKIKWHGAEEEFNTPSAWATHCKRLVNPIKRSGCGWASVKYKGRKLDTWKSIWSRRHHPNSPFRSTSPHQAALSSETHSSNSQTPAPSQSSDLDNGAAKAEAKLAAEAAESQTVQCLKLIAAASMTDEVSALPFFTLPPPLPPPPPPTKPIANGAEKSCKRTHTDAFTQAFQNEAVNLTLVGPELAESEKTCKKLTEASTVCSYVSGRRRASLSYASLGKVTEHRDSGTFVKCEQFSSSQGIKVPFSITVSTNAMMLMDFHSHLSTTEVVGYLGGSWCPQSQSVRITQAFPCKCLLTDVDKAAIVEDEIRQRMDRLGCSVVGWYHSHPLCQPDPTLRDVENQMHHQLCMRGPGGTFLPCVGFILSPYDTQTKLESTYEVFFVMPPAEDNPDGYWMPIHLKCTVHQSTSLSEELLNEMNQLADFYRGSVSRVRWKELWSDSTSYLEKLKNSLRSKLPKDQIEGSSFFSFIQQLLTRK